MAHDCFYVGFIALWVAAWIVALAMGWSDVTAYWAAAKVVVWVLYPVVFWQAPVREQLSFIGLQTPDLSRGMALGGVAMAAWVVLSIAVAPLRGQYFVPTPMTVDVLYACLLTPFCEEWLFRGYIQTAILRVSCRFWMANGLTSLLFLAVHLVGWSFQSVLATNALSVYPLVILALSLVLGYIRHRSGSLVGSILILIGPKFHLLGDGDWQLLLVPVRARKVTY